MLTFLEANGISVTVAPEEVAALMIDLQKRCEAGEHDGLRLSPGILAQAVRCPRNPGLQTIAKSSKIRAPHTSIDKVGAMPR